MTFRQNIKMTKIALLNLWWSWKSEEFACKLMVDTSVGFYLRHNDPEQYKSAYIKHTGKDEPYTGCIINSVLNSTKSESYSDFITDSKK